MRLVTIATSFALLAPGAAQAIENGAWSTPTGFFFFAAGFTPPPTEIGTFAIRFQDQIIEDLYDGSGHKSPNQFNLNLTAESLAFVHMTNLPLLGGTYGFAIVQPFFTFNGGLKIAHTPISIRQATQGFGNTTVDPVIIQWHLGPVALNGGLATVQLPNGYYRKNALFNPATNYWTYGPHLGATYIGPTGLEVSSYAEFDVNTKNPDTHYHSGAEFKAELAVGQHFGPFTIGPAGYMYQQIEDDSAPGLPSGVRGRVFAAGLSGNYLKRGAPLTYFLNAFKEFGAENHGQGYNISGRVAVSF